MIEPTPAPSPKGVRIAVSAQIAIGAADVVLTDRLRPLNNIKMISHARSERLLAILLSGLAGYVDALGFLNLGGFFVSFMSGNSTRLGVSLVEAASIAVLPALLVSLFVMGVVVGSLVGHSAKRHKRQSVLGLVAILLSAAAFAATNGSNASAIGFMALAMGAVNTVFERGGEVSIGVTYMTGTLVKLGQRLTSAFLGGDRWAWAWYLLLWSGLVLGAVIGAAAYARIGLSALWFAVALASLCCGLCQWFANRQSKQ